MDDAAQLETAAAMGAARFARNPKVAAILLAGSVAQGDVDGASDVDLILYLNEPFTQAEYEAEVAAAKASGGDLHFGDHEKGFGVWHFLNGRKVDFGVGPRSQTEDILDALLLKHDPNPTFQLIARGIITGKPLKDDGCLAAWKQRLADYPAPLAEATVRSCLRFMPAWVMREMGALRDDPFLVYECALPAASNLCGIMAALNRRFHPGKVKRLEKFASELQIAPTEFAQRLRSVFDLPLLAAVQTLDELIRETFDLVAEHMPEIETGPALRRYNAKLTQ
ncbi:MAG: nucleotidyltransferase domain-containing protein [Planctomycetes bacterium]|nr:nucleotidyltransferase domain-containing protein [Planctomycetota bacterium]